MGPISKQELVVLIVFLRVGNLLVISPKLKSIFPSLKNVNDTVIAMLGTILLFTIPADWKKGYIYP